MDKIAKVPHLREELDWLDQTYGVEKEGFFHQEHWQLLVAIMLSAQSTDKQVDEVLPKLYGASSDTELFKNHRSTICF